MNAIQKFSACEGNKYAAATRRVYLSAVKKVLKIVDKAPEDCKSYEEVQALLRKNVAPKKVPKTLRIGPLLRFLDGTIPKNPENIPDYGTIRTLDRLAAGLRSRWLWLTRMWDLR